MSDASTRIRVPPSAARGEIVEVRTLITHPMESGQRRDVLGEKVPRRIINRFDCTLNGEPVFSAELHPAVSVNPYLVFNLRVVESGTLELSWTDDDGTIYRASAAIEAV